MPILPNIPLIKGDRKSKYDYRDNLPVNMTAVIRDVEGDQGYLLTHDGLAEFAVTNGTARGGVFNERFNQHYRVSGNVFESISSTGNVESLGIISGNSTCSFANSFNTQLILSDGKAFLWDGASLSQVLDPELGVPIDCTWFRGIYVFTDGEFLFHSDITNESSISPLKYSSSEFAADPIVAVARNDQNQIIAFNRYSIEYFYFDPSVPTGTSVLVPVQGKTSKFGIVGTHCKTELDGSFFILGGRKEENPTIHRFLNGQKQSVATRNVTQIINKYSEEQLSQTYLESRVVDEDKFLIVHLPNETLLFNWTVYQQFGANAAWTYVKTGVEIDEVWRAKFGVFDPRNSKWIYGDLKENKLAVLDDQDGAQYGEQVENIFYTPIIPLEQSSVNELEVETIRGFAPNLVSSGVSFSPDGITYGKEYFNIISEPDNYNTRYVVRALGYIRDEFLIRFRFVNDGKMAVSNLNVDYD